MESIYYVISWLCHRTCAHCYEDRFRPYYGDDLKQVVGQSEANFARIIANFPVRLGKVILSGGEVLLEPVRETVLYPALELLHEKYGGAAKLIVQTTGDLLNERIIVELLEHHVSVISCAGLDAFHEGIQPVRLEEKLMGWYEKAGMTAEQYHFFGATPDQWIGKLWPRGRAWRNELSTADVAENFCNRWSGGLNFLNEGGSEVSVDPEGNVFPCCLKTKLPIGNLLGEPLERILARLRGNPVFEAINAGAPQRMGIEHGWTEETFLEKSKTILPSGRVYQNLCIGCDRFHEEVLTSIQLDSASARRT